MAVPARVPPLSLKALARLSAAALPLAGATAPAAAADYATRLLRQPAAQVVAGNQERIIILPSIDSAYETNVLPYDRPNGRRSASNLRVSPGVDVSINRLFSRTRVTLAGNFGYDFNTKYKFLDQPRINTSLGIQQPIGGRCAVGLRAFYQQSRFNAFDVVQTTDAKSKSQVYDGNFSCDRPVGFSPTFGATYSKQTSDVYRIFNNETFAYRGGVSYVKPSLGTLNLSVSRQELRRPAIRRLFGINDGTNVNQINLTLFRGVSPRLNFSIGGGYYATDPVRSGLSSTSGASYNASVAYIPIPRLRFGATAARDIINESGISATYVKRDNYNVAAGYTLNARSQVDFSGQLTLRDFNGEDVTNTTTPIGRDRVTQVAASYSLNTLQRLRLTLGVRQLWRNSPNDIYDYKSTILTATIGARF